LASDINTGGIGFSGALTVTFIVLKLTHVIDWSWWWVLSPLWISLLFAAALVAVAFCIWMKE
jgi:hypothetical protein